MLRYDIFYLMAALLAGPVVAVRLFVDGKRRTDWRGRFGHVGVLDVASSPADASPTPAHSGGRSASHKPEEVSGAPAGRRPTVLVHGVSVGEVAAVRRLVDLLAARARVVVSGTTDTGVARARSLYGSRRAVVRYPLDLSWMVRRFLDAVRPDVVALTELEVWPNFVTECTRRGIPVCVVNGRLSASSHRAYRRGGGWARPVFRQLAAVAAQNETYADRFVDLGVSRDRVRVTDTMKWDTSGRPRSALAAEALAAALGIDRTRPLIVAGSTGPGEEEELVATRPPTAQLLLVPRKPERFDAVAALHPAIRRRSRARRDGGEQKGGGAPASEAVASSAGGAATPAQSPASVDLFLLDTMGELELAYALADVAIVGRSLAPMGGSDPIPPVAAGCATIIGPHHENFANVVAALAAGGGITVTDTPMAAAARLLGDEDARRRMVRHGQRVIEEHRGASARTVDLVLGLLGTRSERQPNPEPLAPPGRKT